MLELECLAECNHQIQFRSNVYRQKQKMGVLRKEKIKRKRSDVFKETTTNYDVPSLRVYAITSVESFVQINLSTRCYRKISLPHIPYKDHVTNEEVRAKIRQAFGPHEDLLTIVKRQKTATVWSCLPIIRSGQNHLARQNERGKKTRQTEEEVGRQHQGMDRPRVRQVPEGSGEQGKMETTGCEIICGAPTTHAV